MCRIWESSSPELRADEFGQLFGHSYLKEVQDLSITGGEPTLRTDLQDVVATIISKLSKLKILFLCTNGTRPDVARNFVLSFHDKVEQLFVATSIEGDRSIHQKLRGIDSYLQALETLEVCHQAVEGVKTVISMTLTRENCFPEYVEHVKDLARRTKSTYTFKPLVSSSVYFNNQATTLAPSDTQLASIEKYVDELRGSDPFMEVQWTYLKTGKIPLLEAEDGTFKCLAGNVFAFIRPNGDIFPCCLSSRKIGELRSDFLANELSDLGKFECCPCCQEMCVYPQLNWKQFADESQHSDKY